MFNLPKLLSTPKKKTPFIGLKASPMKADRDKNKWDRLRSLNPFPKLKISNAIAPLQPTSSPKVARHADRRSPSPIASCYERVVEDSVDPVLEGAGKGEVPRAEAEKIGGRAGRGGNRKRRDSGEGHVNNTVVRHVLAG